ncbi:hypothetical protein [Rhizobium leguminosarum]
MDYDLITDDEYDSLPEDAQQKFAALEAICRRSMNRLISDQTPRHFDELIRMQYMITVAAAAAELGVEGVTFPGHLDNPADGLQYFLVDVSAATTRIRLRNSASLAYSVRLSARTRGRIELQIRKLRDVIDGSELPADKRDRLLAKLNELAAELDHTRVSFSKLMSLLAALSVGLAGTTSFLADAPNALTTITSLVGADKEAEEAEARRLGAPPVQKALPAPTTTSQENALDDDIPF